MTTTPTTSTTQRTNGDGRRDGGSFRLASATRPTQVPQLVVALLVIGVSALIAVVGFSQATGRSPVLALAADIGRGEVVESGDLVVVHVASDDQVVTVPPETAASLVGRVAVTDLSAGVLVAPGFFVDRAVVAPGEGVVGLALAPGEYPTVQLAPGDVVDVVSTDPAAGMVVSGAEVFDITELGTQGSRFVSLRMAAVDAAAVTGFAEGGGVRLVLVAGDGP